MYILNWESILVLVMSDIVEGVKRFFAIVFLGVMCWLIDHFGWIVLPDSVMMVVLFTLAAVGCMLIGMIGQSLHYYYMVLNASYDYPAINLMSIKVEKEILEAMEGAEEDAAK